MESEEADLLAAIEPVLEVCSALGDREDLVTESRRLLHVEDVALRLHSPDAPLGSYRAFFFNDLFLLAFIVPPGPRHLRSFSPGREEEGEERKWAHPRGNEVLKVKLRMDMEKTVVSWIALPAPSEMKGFYLTTKEVVGAEDGDALISLERCEVWCQEEAAFALMQEKFRDVAQAVREMEAMQWQIRPLGTERISGER